MPSVARLSFSGEHQDLSQIAVDQGDTEASVRLYFLSAPINSPPRFNGYTMSEVLEEMDALLDEHDRRSSLQLLAALEASFRLDYLIRSYEKKRDPLSRALREIFKDKDQRASLEDDLLGAWKKHAQIAGVHTVVADLRGAFKYRHWLAHGRYWVPKLGQRYDYTGLSILAQTVQTNFGLLAPI